MEKKSKSTNGDWHADSHNLNFNWVPVNKNSYKVKYASIKENDEKKMNHKDSK